MGYKIHPFISTSHPTSRCIIKVAPHMFLVVKEVHWFMSSGKEYQILDESMKKNGRANGEKIFSHKIHAKMHKILLWACKYVFYVWFIVWNVHALCQKPVLW